MDPSALSATPNAITVLVGIDGGLRTGTPPMRLLQTITIWRSHCVDGLNRFRVRPIPYLEKSAGVALVTAKCGPYIPPHLTLPRLKGQLVCF